MNWFASPITTNALLLALLVWGIWHAGIVRHVHKTHLALKRWLEKARARRRRR